MSDLNKLKAQFQYLAGIKDEIKTNLNESTSGKNARLLHYKQANDKVVYGIVQESNKYFIKYAPTLKKEMSVSDFLYIGGKENLLKERYETYKECEKKLHSKIVSINEAYSRFTKKNFLNENEEEIPKNSEIDAQTPEVPVEEPVSNEPAEVEAPVESPTETPAAEETSTESEPETEPEQTEEVPAGDETESPASDSGEEKGDLEGEIKSLIGKITAQFQEMGDVTPSLAKNAINSIISSTKSGIKQLSDTEKEELQRRIEKDGEKLDENEEESDVISGTELMQGLDDDDYTDDNEEIDYENMDMEDLGLDEELIKEMVVKQLKKVKQERLIESIVRKKVYERYDILKEGKSGKDVSTLTSIIKEEYEKMKEEEKKPELLKEGILNKIATMGVKGIAKLGDAVKGQLEKAVTKMLTPADLALANDVISKIEKGELNEGVNDIFRKLKPAIMLFILLKIGTMIASNPAMAQEADEQLKNFGKAKTELKFDGGDGDDVGIESMSGDDIKNIVKNIVEKTGLKLKNGYPDYKNAEGQELKKLIDQAKSDFKNVKKMNVNGKPLYVVMYNGLPYAVSDATTFPTDVMVDSAEIGLDTDLPKDLPKITVIPKYIFDKVKGKIHTSKDASGKKVKHFTGTTPHGEITGYDISVK